VVVSMCLARRSQLSTALRVVVSNVFLIPIFSYICRLFVMPPTTRKYVENRLLSFITPVPFAKLGFFTQLRALYGIRTCLVDLRNSNCVAIVATIRRNHANMATLVHALQRRQRGERFPAGALQATPHPVDAWLEAAGHYEDVVGEHVGDVLTRRLGQRGLPSCGAGGLWPPGQPMYIWLYQALQEAAGPLWEAYLADRVSRKGWDGWATVRGVKALGRVPSISPAQRWTLLKIHLNGVPTTWRFHRARVVQSVAACTLCGRADGDSVPHLFSCNAFMIAYDRLCREVRPRPPGWALRELFFQGTQDGSSLRWYVAVSTAALAIRRKAREGFDLGGTAGYANALRRFTECPWLLGDNGATLTRSARRKTRVVAPPPTPPEAVLYRSDGASRGQGAQGVGEAGWGVAVWEPPHQHSPTATARGALGRASNNVAEYTGLRVAFERALRQPHRDIVFEVDSGLVANQVNGRDACRHPELRGLYEACVSMGRELRSQGKRWKLRHTYREFNVVADFFANQGLEGTAQAVYEGW